MCFLNICIYPSRNMLANICADTLKRDVKLNSCRPKHRSKDAGPASKGLSELSRQSSLRKTSLAERISSGATGSPAPGRRATAGGNVFNRWVGSLRCL